MGHYTVLVIGDNVDEQLAPYSEHLPVEPYRASLDESDLADWDIWRADHPDDDGTGLFASPLLIDEQGLYRMSTYNWSRKWDWYVVGGRWRGSVLRVKPNVAAYTSENGGVGNTVPQMGYADVCRKVDVDWEGIAHDAAKAARHSWRAIHAIMDRYPPVIPWSVFLARYEAGELSWEYAGEQYGAQPGVMALRGSDRLLAWTVFDEYLCLEEDYVQSAVAASGVTYAVLKDGQWYEDGEMAADESTQEDWKTRFAQLIADVPDDTLLTIVDYHM